MPDETEKEDRVEIRVPQLPPDATFKQISEHAKEVYRRLWDGDHHRFHSLKKAVQLLFVYAWRLPGRLALLEDQIIQLESQIVAFETWRADSTREAKAMFDAMEAEVAAKPELAALLKSPQLVSIPENGATPEVKAEVRK